MSTIRVTLADLRQAVRESLGQRAESDPGPSVEQPPGCVVPTETGGTCAQPGVVADPQTGRYRCLYHVHALGEVS